MKYVLIILLGTVVLRILNLHRDSEDERKDIGYQLTLFIITFVFYTIVFEFFNLII